MVRRWPPTSTRSSTTPSPTAPPTGRCPTSPPSSACRPDAGRREIAYATALRRRKGTPSALEDFAEVVTGWPTRVIEGWQTTLWCQQLRHPVRRTASLDLRHGEHLLVGTGLDPARRRVTPGGPYHPAAVTAEVFPWQVLRYDGVEVAPLGAGRFALHPLGVSAPLYLAPRAAGDRERRRGRAPARRAADAAAAAERRASCRCARPGG